MIPTPETVDKKWLTEQLQANGFDVEVLGFSARQIGTGQIGQCIEYQFDYLDSKRATALGAPASLVGKFPSDDPTSRATGVMLRNYYREVRFYQTLAERLPVRTPRCYFADIQAEGPDFALLLENLSPAVQGDQLGGCDEPVAAAALRELVGLQAPSWNDAALAEFDWLVEPAGNPTLNVLDLYRQLLPGFVDRYQHALQADQVAIISRVAESPGCPLFAPLGEPFCLEHVDYRLDNMLIDHGTNPPAVTVVDWQSIKLGPPMNDVAYFLGAGLQTPLRRDAESRLVQGYHQELVRQGVEEFDWQTCWEAYRRSAFAGFAVTVIASMIVGQTERGDQMFITMAGRHSRHALDLGSDEFLD